jgi:formylglycine-generating enzyme required for sulfatase activity
MMTGRPYRLLTEAEWEYATRAGTTTAYYWGDKIGQDNADCIGCGSKWDNQQTSPVGSFKPNAFGLYDTSGDVWQSVQDCDHGDYNGAPADGSAWTSGECGRRVIRGGSWFDEPQTLRSANHSRVPPGFRNGALGIRVARTLVVTP